jgi:hypothetical protein
MMKPRVLLASGLLLATLSTAPRRAAADDSGEEALSEAARELYVQAKAAREAGDWDLCYAKSKAAAAIDQTPTISGLLGDCALGAHHPREAAEALAQYLAHPSPKAAPELQKYLEERFTAAKKEIAVVALSASVADARCDVDGAAISTIPTTLYLDPGRHQFHASHADYLDAEEAIDLAAGSQRDVRLVLRKRPKQNGTPQPPPHGDDDDVPSYAIAAGAFGVLAAGGFALAIASAVVKSSAEDDAADIQADLSGSGASAGSCNSPAPVIDDRCSELGDAVDTHDTYNDLLPLGLIVGAGALAVSATFIVLIVIDDDGDDGAKTTLRIRPNVTQPGVDLNITF